MLYYDCSQGQAAENSNRSRQEKTETLDLKKKMKGVDSVDIIKEREILQKCLCASVGKEKCKKITEQFISVAVENNLNYSGSILHDFMRLAEIEISLRQIR